MAKDSFRRKCRHIILIQASIYTGRTYRMRNLQQAVKIVRQAELVKPEILIGAGFNSKDKP